MIALKPFFPDSWPMRDVLVSDSCCLSRISTQILDVDSESEDLIPMSKMWNFYSNTLNSKTFRIVNDFSHEAGYLSASSFAIFLKYFTLFLEQFTYCSFQNNSQQLGLQKTLHYYFSFL